MKRYAIGLDNGGTVIKAAVFDLQGQEIAVASRQTPISTPHPGYTERDMEELWLSNCACVRDVLEKSAIDPNAVIGVAVCGHGKGLYPWGKDGKPAYQGIVSTDNRAWRYPEQWRQDGTFERLYPQLCQQLMACQQVSLLAWMKEHEPEVYDNIEYVFSVKDYIRFRLTGVARSEATDISGSGLMDIRHVRFDPKMLEAFGIGEVYEKLPPLCYSSEVAGYVTAQASQLTGLPQGTPVAGGMFDIDSCAIALDVTHPEALCTIAGTWSINEFISREPIVDGSIAMNSLYAIPGYYLIEECSATSAGNLEWLIQNCLENEPISKGKKLYQHIDDLAASVPADKCDVYFLPFLYGTNAHPLGKGAFVGLTTYHRKAHMARAVYEGVAYSHKTHIDRLLSARTPPKTIRMAGGVVNSPFWVQMFADVLGFPIETVRVKELGALGCAMAAAVAAGVYLNYPEAAREMVRIHATVEPREEMTKIYREKYEKYRAVSAALDTIWERFAV
ncbi:MAG: FGGY-family carbohydrate kinase [Oscillospiraceae bacterium]